MPDEDWQRFFEWSEAVDPGRHRLARGEARRCRPRCTRRCWRTTVARRADPRDDLISVLAQVEIEGRRLSDAELTMFLVQLLVAGNETTRNMISGGLVALADRPGRGNSCAVTGRSCRRRSRRCCAGPRPSSASCGPRRANAELGGQAIRDGDPVLMLYASANRDERQFGPTADRFDIGRDPNHHVAFGFGAHFCIGATLARIEARQLLEELLDRFETVEPAGDVERSSSAVIAGVKRAPFVFR